MLTDNKIFLDSSAKGVQWTLTRELTFQNWVAWVAALPRDFLYFKVSAQSALKYSEKIQKISEAFFF